MNQFCDHVDVIRCDKLKIEEIGKYHKILFSPGPGLPKEYPILYNILRKYGCSKSILGICLGQQAIAEFYGCVLHNIPNPMHGITSRLNHFNNCNLYRNVPISFQIGHYHSWIVSGKGFSADLEITSVNENGFIMSVRHKKHDITAVQFHPESILTEYGLKLIENWLSD